MSYAIRSQQARCAALGFSPGPIDGVNGPRTRAAYADAAASQQSKGLPFEHTLGVTRIHWHWSAGTNTPSVLDKRHYHFTIDGGGRVEQHHRVEEHLAHTLNANGGAIAVSLCGMMGAIERPFARGPAPLLPAQIAALAKLSADLGAQFDIPVSRFSMLSHAEVQPTLHIHQRGKWDICWLPGMDAPRDAVDVGDILREQTRRVRN